MIRSSIVALVVACTLAGCQSMPFKKKSSSDGSFNSTSSSGLGQGVLPRFADVPIPAKSNENIDRTYVYQSNTLEIGRLVYTSGKSMNEIAQFFINTSPNYGWTLENMIQAEGVHLYFTKPGKRMNIMVKPSEIKKWRSLFIINLTPTDSGTVAANSQRLNSFPLNP